MLYTIPDYYKEFSCIAADMRGHLLRGVADCN